MRLATPLILCSLTFLALALGLAAQLLFPAPALTTPTTTTDNWRRTATGWERTHSWPTPVGQASSLPRVFIGHASHPPHQPDAQARGATGVLPVPASDSSPRAPRSALRVPQPRLDTHPAVLALLQITGSLLALAFFQTNSHQLSLKSFLSSISHSFRASAFG